MLACVEHDDIVLDDAGCLDFRFHAVAQHHGFWLVQDGQLVHELLGLELLRDADDDVQDDDTADRVGNRRGGQTRKPQAAATTGTLSDSTR